MTRLIFKSRSIVPLFTLYLMISTLNEPHIQKTSGGLVIGNEYGQSQGKSLYPLLETRHEIYN